MISFQFLHVVITLPLSEINSVCCLYPKPSTPFLCGNNQEDGLPLEIKILKEEPLDDFPGTEAPGEARRRRKKSVKKEGRRKVGTTSFPCPQCPNTFQNQLKMVRHASKKHGLYLPVPLKPGLTRCPFCVEIFNEGDRARLCGIEGRPIIDSSRAWMPPILMP